MNQSYETQSLEPSILSFCLRKNFYGRVKNILDKSMFQGEWGAIWQSLVDAHCEYGSDVSRGELQAFFDNSHPALPDSARGRYRELLEAIIEDPGTNYDLQFDVVRDFWRRERAREIGQVGVDIFLGKREDFGELKRLVEKSVDKHLFDKKTYTEIDLNLEELLDAIKEGADFPFDWPPLSNHISGLDRGHFGIIFARPETGKTTFCSFLAQKYLKQGFVVAVWGNEEPAIRTKLRIIQSYFGVTQEELRGNRTYYSSVWNQQVAGKLRVLDCVGTPIHEIDDWCKLNTPDVVFVDQLDKVKIEGKYNRGDEKLKEIYIQAREIAKRNSCLVWGVSQASAEAENMAYIEYQYLDNSKTGKAGEADLILGIGMRGARATDNIVRSLCISKNKKNGVHENIDVTIDIQRGIYEGPRGEATDEEMA